MLIAADREITHAETAFAEFGSVRLVSGRTLETAQLRDADILLVRSVTRVDEALLRGTPVRFVGSATSGTDHVAIDYLRSRGISFAAAPGCNARAVAEHVLACVLLEAQGTGRDPARLTAGIIGYGNVGMAVTTLLQVIGVTCKLNDPPCAEIDDEQRFVSLEEALDSDIVTLHVPLTESGPHRTRDLIDARAIRLLRSGAILINTARGGVINEAALSEALDGVSPVKAVIDCWQGEPAIDRGLLRRAFLATPHIAGHSVEARTNATSALHQALAHHLGHPPRWRPDNMCPGAVTLSLADGADDPVRLLARAVLASHDPRGATVSLRRAIGLPGHRVSQYFDEVRRNMGTRREFSHYAVAGCLMAPDTARALRALGFCVAR